MGRSRNAVLQASLLNWPASAGDHAPSCHCHRRPSSYSGYNRRASVFILIFNLAATRSQWTYEKFRGKEEIHFLAVKVGCCCRGASWPPILLLFCLPWKFKDVIGDALVDIHATWWNTCQGRQAYVHAGCDVCSRKAEMMFASRLKADGFFCISPTTGADFRANNARIFHNKVMTENTDLFFYYFTK